MLKKRIFMCGLIGIIGILLTILSDLFLIGRACSAFSFLKLGTQSMAEVAQWRITFGTFLGVFALPFQILGLVPLYFGLKSAGRLLALIACAINTHAIIMGVAFHTAYGFIGSGWRLFYIEGQNNKNIEAMIIKFDHYWRIIIFIMVTDIIISSSIYIIQIIRGKSIYSKWMALMNPIFIFIVLFPLVFVLPAPIGGFIGPAYFNIATLIFVSVVLYSTYKGLNTDEVALV